MLLQAPRARSGGRLRSELLEHRTRRALLDEACFPVAEGEMGVRQKRAGLRSFLWRAGLVPEGLRCDEVGHGSSSFSGSEGDRTGRLSGGCAERG